MKKILIIVLSFFISFNTFAEELWNGFTDDMTVEQVLAKGNKLFGCNGQNFTKEFTPEYKWLDNGPCHWRDDSARFPTPDYVIVYKSKLSQYEQDTVYWRGNAEFYFYKGKLSGVRIFWNIDYETVYNSAVNKYGSNYKKEDYSIGDWYSPKMVKVCHWTLENKEIFISGSNNCDISVFSNKATELFNSNKKKEQDEKLQKETEEKQYRSQQLVF